MSDPLELEIHATHLDIDVSVPPSFQIWAVTRDGRKRHVRTVTSEREVVEVLRTLGVDDIGAWTRARELRKTSRVRLLV